MLSTGSQIERFLFGLVLGVELRGSYKHNMCLSLGGYLQHLLYSNLSFHEYVWGTMSQRVVDLDYLLKDTFPSTAQDDQCVSLSHLGGKCQWAILTCFK